MRGFFEFVLLDGALLTFLFFTVTFLIALLQQWSAASSISRKLSSAPLGVGNVYAAIGGAITPFCSCSTVPVVSSMLRARVRFGFCMTFLMASPMVSESAIVVMLRYTGLRNVFAFIALTMIIPILIGMALDKLGFARFVRKEATESSPEVEGFVAPAGGTFSIPFSAKIKFALFTSKQEVRNALPYLGVGLLVGGLIHELIPAEWLLSISNGVSPELLIPLMALIGIPLYFNMATAVPIVFALADKGLGIAPMMAFLVAGGGTSLPEMILLMKIFKKELVIAHAATMFVAAISVGYFFRWF